MCGIAGFSGHYPPELLDGFNSLLAHRGPDAFARYFDGNNGIGLAHRRLAILDLSAAGIQPMWDSLHQIAIVFNGEIYNFRELRKDLEGDGFQFKTRTDTEVIIYLYKKHGTAMLAMLNGIFALAIWDSRNRTLVLARDQVGTKPLYYTNTKRGFLFASEIKALMLAEDFDKRLNPIALASTLTYLWTPGPDTIFAAVKKVLPGQCLTIQDGNVLREHIFEELPLGDTYTPGSAYEHAFMLQSTLRRAVRRQLVSDVPIGAMFSGGLDSSAIVAFAREANPDASFKCFTIGFSGKEAVQEGLADDLIYARRIASHLNVELEEITVGTNSINMLERAIYHLDEPSPDPATINVLLISQLARQQGITVLLSGVGGDDLLGGYRRHIAHAVEPFWSWLPSGVRKAVASTAGLLPQSSNFSRRIGRVLAQTALDSEERFASYFMWAPPGTVLPILSGDIRSQVSAAQLSHNLLSSLNRIPGNGSASRLDRMLVVDIKHFLADHNLNYVDKLSMAEGIEVRVPFLDKEMIDFAFSLPSSSKLRHLSGKWVLKKALEDYLPMETIYRPKTGFGAPLRHWIRNELKWLIDELMTDQTFRERGLFDPHEFRTLVALDRTGKIDGAYSIFAVLCIELWCRQFLDSSFSAKVQ